MRQKRTTAQALRQAVGIGESRDWSFWFMIALVLGLVANVVVLMACLAPRTKALYLFRVDAESLVDAAANTTTVAAEDLRIDALPSSWYWGLTGVCVEHDGDAVSCKWAFPPVMTVGDMMTFAIEAKLGSDASTSSVAQQMKPWASALAQVESHLAPSSRPTTFFTVAFAAAVASTALSIILFILGILSLSVLRGRFPRWILYLISFLDAASFLSAGILIVLAMDQGPRGLINYSPTDQGSWRSHVGSTLLVLFVGVLFKFLSIPLFFCLVFFAAFMAIFVGILAISCCCDSDDSTEDDEYPFCEYPNDGNVKA
ncbi:hypothetical protein B0T10DRAFT_453182 [Thelonectria olida]|uniref:Uncharacterized protein n=1 Tax=Thelonectria olida TaxID=1576542 RepID=A0A9P8WII4_9HYPO|nr:hypothetical protein B0T10DRAFT_453182 [Thelonectria olida]